MMKHTARSWVRTAVGIALVAMATWAGHARGSDGKPNMGPIWERLARAHVLVQVNHLGVEPQGTAAPRFGWEQALVELDRAAAADPTLLTRIHMVSVDEADATGLAQVRETKLPSPSVTLSLQISVVNGAISTPDAAAIARAVAGHPVRAKSAHEPDERFLLFLARAGFGLYVHDRRAAAADGQPAYLAALRALGDAVAAAPLERLSAALTREIDPHAMPQLDLLPAAKPDVALHTTPSAEFPMWAARSRITATFAYTLTGGAVKVPDLAAADAALTR